MSLEAVSDRELMLRWLSELDNVADHQSLADEYFEEIQRRGREYETEERGNHALVEAAEDADGD